MTTTFLTEALAHYAVREDLGDLSPEVLDLVRRSLIDTVGVILAARHEPSVTIARRVFGEASQAGDASVLFDGTRASAPTAALLNGIAGHALDFDDVTEILYGHPSAALWPAVLAAAQKRQATERDVVEAFLVGFTVISAVAAGMDVRDHYSHGWHSTATIGILGASAAVARLARLDLQRTRRALGLAVSMSGGSRQNFGTMTKPLHLGLISRDAVIAADLAGAGFTADESAIEAPLGFYAMFNANANQDAALAVLNGDWALIRQGLNVKKYPCCFNTHRTADAILGLIEREDLKAEEVRSVLVTLEPGGFDPLIRHRPVTGLEGKFSAEYVIAAALLDRRVDLASFTDEMVQRPEAQDLVRRIDWATSPTPPTGRPEWEYAYSSLQVSTTQRDFEARTDFPRGDHRLPLTADELSAKFLDCAKFADNSWNAEAALNALWSFGARDKILNASFPVV